MNVLLTSSGRRTYLCEYFKKALGNEGLLFAANSCMSPALLAADGFGISPLIYSDDYIPWLHSFCKENKIGLIVPLFDIDLPVLSRHREEFLKEGVCIAVSDPSVTALCSDKLLMHEKLSEYGIMSPDTYLTVNEAQNISGEVVIKPRFGMGSIGVMTACGKEETEVLYKKCGREVLSSYLKYEAAACPGETVIIQKKLKGQEYGLDVINDFNGNYVETVVKKKAAMRAGETDEACTLSEDDRLLPVLKDTGRKISQAFKHRGNMDVDIILDDETGVPYVIDMNARFGGGYPFSHAAGVDLPGAYVLWAQGKPAPAELFKAAPGVHCYKDIKITKVVS